MTLGDGIFWSTILILLTAGIYGLSVKKKWRTFGRVLGILVLIGAVIGVGVWGYFRYTDRPYVVETLGGVRLGMTPLEVTLAKGKSDINYFVKQSENPASGWPYSLVWIDTEFKNDRPVLNVLFQGSDPDSLIVSRVCERDGYSKLLGFGNYDMESSVVIKLGEPSHVSIHKDGLVKIISYDQWNVSYEIQRGSISEVCISQLGAITYADEYGEESEETDE